ncbi:MAG: hypothetical protein JXB32_10810, partial [Deltaproteobacteria bacterium]|nr:hypothetical protein [Deltaproteobacteria bacterium]
LLLAATTTATCTRAEPAELPRAPRAAELDRLPSTAVAVVRVRFDGPGAAVLARALREAGGERLACFAELLPDLRQAALAFIPRGRELAALLLLDGSVARSAVDRCGADLAQAFAGRPLPEGSVPAVKSAQDTGHDGATETGSWLVALDLETDRLPSGVRGPLAESFSRLAEFPVVAAASGGEALRTLSGMAATYLPLSSMGEAADRIEALAYGLAPRADGSAVVRLEVELSDAEAAESLARQVRLVGRIGALDGERVAWQEFRAMVRDLAATVLDDGRRVRVDATLTPEGLAGVLR